MVASVLFRNCK